MRKPLELDGDLGRLLRQGLAGAKIEGYVAPAPVVHEQAEGRVRRRGGFRTNARLVQVAFVLAPNGLFRGLFRPPRTYRLEDVLLFLSDSASATLGGSMATNVRSCNRWFWTMSRTTPERS